MSKWYCEERENLYTSTRLIMHDKITDNICDEKC